MTLSADICELNVFDPGQVESSFQGMEGKIHPKPQATHTHTLIIQNIKIPLMVVPRKIPGKHPAPVLISHQSPTPSPDRGGT
jgi:hypothetical protein